MRNRLPGVLLILLLSIMPPPAISADGGGSPAMQEGFALYRKGEYKGAIGKFQAAYQKNETPEAACFSMALCYQGLNDQVQARRYYEFILQQFPKSAYAIKATSALAKIGGAAAPSTDTFGTGAPSAESLIPGVWSNYRKMGSGHMIIMAMVNNKPVPMMFDTGAEYCFFTNSQLEKFDVKVHEQRSNATMMGVSGQAQVTTAMVTIQVGGLTRQSRVFIQDDRSLEKNQGSHALVGLPLLGENFFGDCIVEIDDRRSAILFRAPTDSASYGRNGQTVPFARSGKNIVVTPTINGRECQMCLDTGAASVVFSDKQFSALGFSRPTSAARGHSIGIGGMRTGFIFDIDTIKLGPVERRAVQAAVSVDGTMSEPLLGVSFLEGLHFVIDPRARVLRFLDN